MSDDRIIGTVRTPESHWRTWLNGRQITPLPSHLRPGAAARLVVVAPHPDDEILACGGLLSMHVARGGRVAILGVTDGEASHPGYSAAAARDLGRIRRLERERGLTRLGISSADIACLGLADGRVAENVDALSAALGQLLRPDDLVVSTWSLDGHPDHDATGAATALACDAVGCAFLAAPVWMWHWGQPDDARVPWATLRTLRLSTDVMERKASALAEHASQLAPRENLGAVLDTAIRTRAMRDTEYYFMP